MPAEIRPLRGYSHMIYLDRVGGKEEAEMDFSEALKTGIRETKKEAPMEEQTWHNCSGGHYFTDNGFTIKKHYTSWRLFKDGESGYKEFNSFKSAKLGIYKW